MTLRSFSKFFAASIGGFMLGACSYNPVRPQVEVTLPPDPQTADQSDSLAAAKELDILFAQIIAREEQEQKPQTPPPPPVNTAHANSIQKAAPAETPAAVSPAALPKAKPHPPRTAPTTQTVPFATLIRDNTHTAQTYSVGGKTFTVTPRVFKALAATGLPTDALIALCARESDCQPKRINSDSDACGLFQFIPTTLYEKVYQHGEPYRRLIERYVQKRDEENRPIFAHRPISEQARTQLTALCLQPEFNAALYAAYTKPKVEAYNDFLGNRTITAGELVILNNLGLAGMQRFFRQVMTDKASGTDTIAQNFFTAAVGKQNPSLIKDRDGTLLTVRQSYNRIMNGFGGWGTLQLAAN